MIADLMFKTPDVTDQIDWDEFSEDDAVIMKQLIKQHVEYNEYITVRFDTETKSVKVL